MKPPSRPSLFQSIPSPNGSLGLVFIVGALCFVQLLILYSIYIYILYRFDVPFWLEFAVVVLGLGMFDDANEQNRSLAKEAVLKVQA